MRGSRWLAASAVSPTTGLSSISKRTLPRGLIVRTAERKGARLLPLARLAPHFTAMLGLYHELTPDTILDEEDPLVVGAELYEPEYLAQEKRGSVIGLPSEKTEQREFSQDSRDFERLAQPKCNRYI
jgi:hypothetical protein